MSLQQQNKNLNMQRNASFVRRLNDDFFNQQHTVQSPGPGEQMMDVYTEFGDLRQIHKGRDDAPS